MVGVMVANWRESVASLINSAKSAIDIPSKLQHLRRLKDELSHADSQLLSEFLPSLLDFHTDQFSPVRKFITEMIGEIGLKHVEFIPEIVHALITMLKDGAPAVARQAITCGMDLFRSTIIKVAIQGLHSSELDDSLSSSWAWVLKFREEIYSIAFQAGSDGRRLLALKFIEAVILLYTPDPSGSSEPLPDQTSKGNFDEFNILWLRGGHSVLSVGDLSVEASRSLGFLLDQLRFPTIKSLSYSLIIVLINSLSAVAKKRPAFYGRIMPVLLGLDYSSSVSNGIHVSGLHHTLKNAFLSCLQCTHPGAAPWRDRLTGALREMKAGELAEQAIRQVSQNNGKAEWTDGSSIFQEEKSSIKAQDPVHESPGRKRSGGQDISDLIEEDDWSGKRVRPTPVTEEVSKKEAGSGPTTSRGYGDSGHVQQLVDMFGAFVAQGEKDVGSLEILISSISNDLLAEVVIANMRNLPPNFPKTEGGDGKPLSMGSHRFDGQFKHLSSFLADLQSLTRASSQTDSVLDAQPSASNEPEEQLPVVEHPNEQPVVSAVVTSSEDVASVMENGYSAPLEDVGNLENAIPGLNASTQSDGLPDAHVVSSLESSELEEASQDQASSFGRSSLDLHTSISTDHSEELSPKAGTTDVTSINSSATTVGLPAQLVLPKMSAPVIDLADEQKDQLQELAFVRIIEAYKQIGVAGGSEVRFSVLAYLGVQLPLELDPWKLLRTHVLADYVNHEGHELTLRVLYRLFGEAEEDCDFFLSTTAKSAYEMLLLAVAETLRDSFPASDKSLSRLLNEVPYLPKSIFKLLECLCCPGNNDSDEKEVHNGDRVTQGLSAVWSLILLRPPIREACLKIALQSAVHHLEEVRMKAIRLVANKLYPLSSISQQIENYAKEMLLSATNVDQIKDKSDADESNVELQRVQRSMSLYFALCTKKHALFRLIFVVYGSTSNAVKQAIHRQIPLLVRTIGSSSELLEIISDPPTGSDKLLMKVLQTLTDGTIPSTELVSTIMKLYDTKVKDVEVLIPILPFLPKDEVLLIFPQIVNSPLDSFQAALARILQGSPQSGQVLTPAEILIAIHGIDPDRDGIPLKKVTDACNVCFDQREIFTQQVLAKVLNQLVEHIPLPLLFMRTVLQAIGAFPSLVDFIMETLSRLVSKQIWKYPKLWVGFLKCALLTKPQSFSVLLQLPPAQLENALNRTAALKAPLIAHASQPKIRSTLPRSVLVVLGIASDPQNSSQAQAGQAPAPAPAPDTGNLSKEIASDNPKESSSAS